MWGRAQQQQQQQTNNNSDDNKQQTTTTTTKQKTKSFMLKQKKKQKKKTNLGRVWFVAKDKEVGKRGVKGWRGSAHKRHPSDLGQRAG